MTDRAEQHLIAFPSIVELMGGSPAAERARAAFDRAASATCPVLLISEPGLDAAAVARTIHDRSARFGEPFVVAECAAEDTAHLEERIFGSLGVAGTLALVDVQELSSSLQARLAQVLNDGDITGGLIATLSGLDRVPQDAILRRDLLPYFAERVELPPLRQRPADLPTLIGRLVEESATTAHLPAPTFTREAMILLSALPWRRNFDELREVLDLLVRAAAGGIVRLEDVLNHIPVERMTTGYTADTNLREARLGFERQFIASVLQRHRGRMEDAARSLGIQRTNLYRKVRQLGIGLQKGEQK